jgi:hypothetical protein
MSRRRALVSVCAVAIAGLVAVGPLPAAGAGGSASIQVDDLQAWLTYLASDELEGRGTFSAGLGLAAAYIQTHLRAWGARPAGDPGSFLQIVRVRGVRSSSRSSVTVRVGRQTRTFKDGEGVTFPRNAGGRQQLVIDRVEFVGYGLDVPSEGHTDFRDRSVNGAAVVWLGPEGPRALDSSRFRRLLTGRSRYAIEQRGAAASLAPPAPAGRGAAPPAGTAGRGGSDTAPHFTTSQRLDAPIAPAVTVSEAFLTFLFSEAPVRYPELKRRANARDPLPGFTLDNVTITFDVDADYTVVRTQLTRNVIGILEGSDPVLKDTYVALGAHYDHVGYAETEPNAAGTERPGAPGRIGPGAAADAIWNGADDDGSGTVALMALAKAFAEGTRPRRSLLFVWHAGEERGLLGSRYFADHPSVPLDSIVAQLNLDMIGRNRDDSTAEANTVYLVGSDRISSELHELSREANRALPEPLTLNYEMNDPADVEQLYTRSDHYSYAAKGIPIIFFTTGLHPDYHANTDEVSKIEFAKMRRVTQLVYETVARVANLDHAPARDFQGPRAGKDTR